MGMNARALGMGGAYVASCHDASASYWNPAGLAGLERMELLATYTVFPETSDFSQFVFALPLNVFRFPVDESSASPGPDGAGTLGISFVRYEAAYDIEARQTDSLNPDYLFADTEGCFGLSYGLPLQADLSLGIQIKGLFNQLDRTTANGFGLDAGLLWQSAAWSAGLAVRDLWTRLDWGTGTRELFPPTVKAGMAYTYIFLPNQTILLAVDLEKNFTQEPLRPHAGLEYNYNRVLFARGGYDDGEPCMGGGVRIPRIGWGQAALELDYAALVDRIAGWDHWITFKVEF
jgi:hypothetical protein